MQLKKTEKQLLSILCVFALTSSDPDRKPAHRGGMTLTFQQYRLAILALCLIAMVGLIAFATAQAESTPLWTLSSSDEVGPILPVELAGKVEKTLNLLTKIAGIKVGVSCTKLTLDKALLEAEGKGTGTLLFSGCQVLLNGVTSAPCEPKNKGTEKGVIASTALKGQLVLHESATLTRIEPQTGTVLAQIEMSEACPIGENDWVFGVFYAKDSSGEFEVLKEAHTVEEGPLTKVWVISDTAEHKTTFDGSVSLSPAGAHLQRGWNGSGG
jgi:hypothetical protein